MRIALAQINPTVGDVAGNRLLIEQSLEAARSERAELVVFPELVIVGYPPKDLLLKPAIIEQAREAVAAIAAGCVDLAAIIGYPCPSDQPTGRSLYNAAALCAQGRIVHHFLKSLLPTYDVFDEHRYFEPGPTDRPESDNGVGPVATIGGVPVAVSICEDLWNDREVMPRQLYHHDPVARAGAAGAKLLINASASPFVIGKHAFRLRLIQAAARRLHAPVLFCNQVGGNDELVFDGSSCAVDAQGRLIAQGRTFAEDLVIVDLPHTAREPALEIPQPVEEDDVAGAYHALVLGLKDYCRKCGFKSVVLGLSGGIDSAVCCALAVEALGAANVRGVAMPSRYSSHDSLDDARELAEKLGVRLDVIPIDEPHGAFERTLGPVFEGLPPDVTEENLQARIRGVILMAISNKFGSMLVTTGNKSELAVGYCTLYGDMAGGLAVLSDVPKTLVWRLARWINAGADSPLRRAHGGPVIPERSITKAPTAELRPNQTDQDSLPPYEVLDVIIERYVEQEQSAPRIIAETNLPPEVVLKVVRMIDLNEYKRKQAAPGLKITGRAFGFGRRMPIAQRFDSSWGPTPQRAATVRER